MPQVTVAMVLNFLAWLATSSNRVPSMLSAHYATLADPLHFGLGVVVPQRELKLLFRGVSSNRPRHRPPHITWSLHRVLRNLSFEGAR